eukprot:Anaeramoba_ignava/a353877_9.p2 GENE.a353877_9~~a353877_9.p2  ORF type:complete len:188 (-),score=38.36 a353877_9:377-940(-)
MKNIILASNSKARLNLLQDNGFNVEVQSTDIEEISHKTKPEEIVVDLAQQKLNAYLNSNNPKDKIVIAADTMIFYKNKLIGKSKNKKEAYNTLKSLSNDEHQIYSAYAIYFPNDKKVKSGFSSVDVKFKNLTDLIIMDYLLTEEWKGAAGAYRIQGIGNTLVKEIKGEFNVAVGLPLNAISALIRTS